MIQFFNLIDCWGQCAALLAALFLLTIVIEGNWFSDVGLPTTRLSWVSSIIGITIGYSTYFTTLKCFGLR